MTPIETIITLTMLVEVALFMALMYRNSNPAPQPPVFRARGKRFYRTRRHTDGTWEIG
jgi:hypothetical protein